MFTFSTSDLRSRASSLFSAYASFTALMMMVRSISNDLVPQPIRSYLEAYFRSFFTTVSTKMTVVIDDHCGASPNELYKAAQVYLPTKISPDTKRLKLGKTTQQKDIQVGLEKNEEITDAFDDFQLTWKFTSVKDGAGREEQYMELTFDKKFKDKVIGEYLPHVLDKAQEIEDNHKVVKLFSIPCRGWESIELDHPSSFDTLAMEPEKKKWIINDLERFLRRKDYYRKIGKAWKRGYLLYGPPGTGKSSLIAAMANYLKFDIYDLELTDLYSDSDLKRVMLSTSNRSIIVIEDIDCNAETQDRRQGHTRPHDDSKLTLSGLLNFIDGLQTSCGDERIFVFTTNHKDKIDPALLRPGRMDVHIHMSYCSFEGFRILANNYLGVTDHDSLFSQIEDLMKNVNATPAEIAEELLKSEDVDVALAGVVDLLKRKEIEASETNKEEKNAALLDDNGHLDHNEQKSDGSE